MQVKYIKAITPLKGYRLFLDMESDSSVIVDLSVKLNTMKCRELTNEALFRDVTTDGNYVIWGGGRVKLTINELMEIVLFGAGLGQPSGLM